MYLYDKQGNSYYFYPAKYFWQRLLGLFRYKQGKGVWLVPCRSIHTFGMKECISLLWLDKRYRIIHVENQVKPKSIRRYQQANSVLEVSCQELQQRLRQRGYKEVQTWDVQQQSKTK